MARTYEDVIVRARRILQDEDPANYRYTNESLVDSANDAMLEVRRVRPDLFIRNAFAVGDVQEADIASTLIPIEEFYFQTLVYFTAAYQMLRDDEFSLDTRAVNLMNKGLAQLLVSQA